ncbi:MAG: 30S ribosomal protein S8 [Parcubacteria group bacterium]|nr:30S ribosomal protein S8 [Parcubacteria group bacterium]
MVTDPIADFLTRIRNACMVNARSLTMPYSRFVAEAARAMQREGFVDAVAHHANGEKELSLTIRYQGTEPVIVGLKRLSRPGRRVYVGYRNIPRIRQGLGIVILSTPAGVLSDREARAKKVGGELLCAVW